MKMLGTSKLQATGCTNEFLAYLVRFLRELAYTSFKYVLMNLASSLFCVYSKLQ